MTCQCQWWWMWSSPAPPCHLRAVKNKASVCCSHQQSALTVLLQTSFPLFILSCNIYLLTCDCLLSAESGNTICAPHDGWSALCLLVNVCMQFKSVFDSYWVKWAICSTFRIESEMKLWNRFMREIVIRRKSVISSYFSYKLMFGWHVIKALTVGVCFETKAIDSFLQATVGCFSSGFWSNFHDLFL